MSNTLFRPITSAYRYGRQHGAAAAWTKVREELGGNRRLFSRDRLVLERSILPHYAAADRVRRVLFVGCERYTRHYEQMFSAKEYWTIEPVAAKRPFGGERHIVAGLQDLAAHAPERTFDVIICNGVFGWGLNAPTDCAAAVAACWSCLVPGGEFVLGWNDVPARSPVAVADLLAATGFEPFVFGPLGTARHDTHTPLRHLFDFYRRPAAVV